MQWLFNVTSASAESIRGSGPTNGIAIVDGTPLSEKPQDFFRAVCRILSTASSPASSSSSPSSSSTPVAAAAGNNGAGNHGVFASSLVPTQQNFSGGHVLRSSFTFGVAAEQVVPTGSTAPSRTSTTDIAKSTSEQLQQAQFTYSANFRIEVASPASAKHGILIGIGPRDTEKRTPMLFDEPGVCQLNCTDSNATLWSSTLSKFGDVVAPRCLEKVGDRYVGAVRVDWHIDTPASSSSSSSVPAAPEGRVRFAVYDPTAVVAAVAEKTNLQQLPVIGMSAILKYTAAAAGASASAAAAPKSAHVAAGGGSNALFVAGSDDFDLTSLVPLVGFSTEQSADCVSIF